MKLTLNPKQTLALYNQLHAAVIKFRVHGAVVGDDVYLLQIYDQLRSTILKSITSSEVLPRQFESWLTGQQRKIDTLNKPKSVEATKIMSDDDGEVTCDHAYPHRRGAKHGKK